MFRKAPAIQRPTADWMDAAQVMLPYAYFTDVPAKPTVALYDTVRRGTPLSESSNPLVPVLSSVTGVVSGEREWHHPLYGVQNGVVIDRMSAEPEPEVPAPYTEELTAEELCEAAERAGIIDELDGIPLALKLREGRQEGCDYLVADAVQVQPYESSAWAVLRDHAEQVVEGLRLASLAVASPAYHIAVCLSGQRRRSLAVRVGKQHLFCADSHYPTGDLVFYGHRPGPRTVVRGAHVRRVGVQACLALYRSVYLHESHHSCVLTVAGDAVREPQNVMVPFGTSVKEILTRCGLKEDPTYLILGEMMTGTAATTQDIPVLPGMTCLLAFTADAIRPSAPRTCIGCGRCVSVCHAGLLPFEIVRRFQNMHYERLATLSVGDCDGCGACSYICPCGIDLAAIIGEARGVDSTVFVELEEDSDA